MRNHVVVIAIVALLCGTTFAQQPGETKSPVLNRKLQVAIKPLSPFVMKTEIGHEGFSIDLWNEIAKANNWAFEYTSYSTVKDVLAAVSSRQADVGIAGISMTDERERVVDFSYPMFNAGLQIMVPDRTSSSWLDAVKNAFSGDLLRILWVMLGIVAVAGHVIWLVERRIDPSFPKAYLPGVGEGLWRASINLATGGFGERTPSTAIGRIVALIWVLAGIILISNFTAAITTNLTVQQIQGNIQGPGDLYGKRVVTVANTTAASYLKSQKISFRGTATIEDTYQLLAEGKADAVVYDSPVLLNHASTTGRGKVRVVGGIFKREFYGIALQSGSVLRESVNRTLLDFNSGTQYQSIYERWFGLEAGR